MKWDKKLNNLSGLSGMKGVIVVSREGLPIAFTINNNSKRVDVIKIAGMIAALFSLAEGAVIENKEGEFEYLYIKGTNCNFLIMPTERKAIIAFIFTDVKLGLLLLESVRRLQI